MEISENLTAEEYRQLYEKVRAYGAYSLRDKKMQKLLKQKKRVVVFKRINTPEKIPAVYMYIIDGKYSNWYSFVALKGIDGDSFLGRLGDREHFSIIKSHLVSRYIERHGWQGSRESCENYILAQTILMWCDHDRSTDEIASYFDDGLMLGHLVDGMMVFKTYVHKSNLSNNQKIKAKWQELKLNDIRRNANDYFPPIFTNNLDAIDNIKPQMLNTNGKR